MARILIVDDQPSMRLLIKYMLERAGYDTVVVESAVEALATVEQNGDIDLVISDISMPGMDGFALLERFGELPAAPPVLMVTARGQDEDHQRVQQLGAVGVLTKPFSSQGLAETVARVLEA